MRLSTCLSLTAKYHIQCIINTENATLFDPLIEGTLYGLNLGLKACIMIFVFIELYNKSSFKRFFTIFL